MKKVLIVAPHPDDAELAMGGTIAKMIDAGWDVIVVDLTDGEPTPCGSVRTREQEARKANEILGITSRVCLHMPNRYLQATLDKRTMVAEVISSNRPNLLFGPILPDQHPDHVATTELVHGGRFEAKLHKTDVPGTPYWAPKQYGYYSTHRLGYDEPSFVVDITDYWERKIKAINAYHSQIKNISSMNQASLVEKTEAICRYFGQCAGFKYGEPFTSYGPIPVKNIDFLL